MKRLIITAVLASACAGQAEDKPTMVALEAVFAERIVALSRTTPVHKLPEEVARVAASVFSNHADVVSAETERRLMQLPPYDPSRLPLEVPQQEYDSSTLCTPQFKEWLQSNGWKPDRVAQTAVAFVSQKMNTGEGYYGRIAVLQAALPDRYYRLGGSNTPTIVIESLGDVLVLQCRLDARGMLMPEKMRWWMRKDSPWMATGTTTGQPQGRGAAPGGSL